MERYRCARAADLHAHDYDFLVLGAGTLVTALVFSQSRFPYLFLVSPFVVVAAFRLGAVGTAVSTILIAIVSSIATSIGHGPIQLVNGDTATKLLVLQLFLATNFGMGLPIAAALAGRERLRAELAQSRDFVQSIVETMNEIVFRADAQGRWTFLNPAWEAIMGFTVEQSLGMLAVDFLHPDDKLSGTESVAALATGNVSLGRSRRRFVNASGVLRQMEVSFRPLFNSNGVYVGTNGSMRDVTDHEAADAGLKQAQPELIHVSRLSAMGAMASTLAHELNQPLGAVANYARGLKRLLAKGDWKVPAIVADTLVEIDEGVVRAGEIVRRLRALVERGDIDRKFENVPELIRESCGIGLVDAKLRGIDLHFEFDPQALSVFVDRIQIQQVLVNLLRNAVDAMADSKIRQIVISTKLTGVFCEIGLQDSGPGIDEDVRQRLFAPFNTSKQSGLGIGLSICRTIIEAHGGQIWCDDAIKNGTKFRLQLPVGEAEEITTL
jgi:two-component system, LuxR family, sensor kinase FixL